MNIITVDFETAYSSRAGYTLSKMQTDAYIMDPRFQTIGVAVKVNDGPTQWYSDHSDDNIGLWLSQFDWQNSAVCCHNTLFDGFILTQRYGVVPKLWLDTLSMGRELYPWLKSHSLKELATHLGIGQKGDEVLRADGKWLSDFRHDELAQYAEYCKNDTDLCYEMAKIMLPRLPNVDIKLIDMTIRMFTEPLFVGDIPALHQGVVQEQQRKAELLQSAAVDRSIIMSNDKFATALEQLGVDPPIKYNSKGAQTWAFAKTDEAFTSLLEHENPDVQALVAARLGVKTTIAETRAQIMLDTARRGPLPCTSTTGVPR